MKGSGARGWTAGAMGLALLAGAVIGAIVIVPALTGRGGDAKISTEELAGLPPIVIVWADRRRARSTGSGDLYVARAEGTFARLVKSWPMLSAVGNGGTYGVSDASWSPGRAWIAVRLTVWNSDPDSQVAIIRPNGRELRPLARSSWTAGHATWSPDARKLAYTFLGSLWVYSPADEVPEPVWQARAQRTITGIAWAPGASRLAVAEEGEGVVTMSTDGTGVARLTHGDDFDPAWSPDGRQVVFARRGSITSLWTVDVVEGRPRRMLVGESAEWSPDGRLLLHAWTREVAEDDQTEILEDVFVADADGQNARALTSDGTSYPVAWSPDGTKILFLREMHDETPDNSWSELWVMDVDGGRQTRLPFNQIGWSVLSADWGR